MLMAVQINQLEHNINKGKKRLIRGRYWEQTMHKMGETFVDKDKESKNNKTNCLADQIENSKANIKKQRKQVKIVYNLNKTARKKTIRKTLSKRIENNNQNKNKTRSMQSNTLFFGFTNYLIKIT